MTENDERMSLGNARGEHLGCTNSYHPIDEVNEENLLRRSLMVEYKAYLSTPDEVRIAAERMAIQKARQLQRSRPPYRHNQRDPDCDQTYPHPDKPDRLSNDISTSKDQ